MYQDNKNNEIKFEIMNNSNEDLSFLLEVRNHPTTREQLENNQVFSLEQCKEWYFSLKTPWYIIYYNNIKVGYFRRNLDEIGCDIHPKYRNLGIAKKVYLKYLKNVNFASLWVFDDNFAKKIYEKVGFKEVEEFKIIRDRKYVKMIYNSENNE